MLRRPKADFTEYAKWNETPETWKTCLADRHNREQGVRETTTSTAVSTLRDCCAQIFFRSLRYKAVWREDRVEMDICYVGTQLVKCQALLVWKHRPKLYRLLLMLLLDVLSEKSLMSTDQRFGWRVRGLRLDQQVFVDHQRDTSEALLKSSELQHHLYQKLVVWRSRFLTACFVGQ